MIVHCLIESVVPHPYRIEMTGYGFVEVGPTLTVSLFDGAITTAFIIIAGKDAILVVHNRSHQVTFTIGIDHTLLLYHGASFGRKLVPNQRKHLFQFLHLVQLYGSTGIALNATNPLAGTQVTQELLAQDIERNHNITNLYHNRSIEKRRGLSGLHRLNFKSIRGIRIIRV
jgi:hypothetical protein